MCQSQQCTTPELRERWRTLSSVQDKRSKNPYRVPLLMCDECAHRTLTVLNPAIKSGDFEIRCMAINKFTLHCAYCQSDFRLELLYPRTTPEATKFCPNCGSPNATTKRDPDMDYWELVSNDLDLSLELARMLYDEWLKDGTYPQFRDYVAAMEEEASLLNNT